jgi:hypothetical protein
VRACVRVLCELLLLLVFVCGAPIRDDASIVSPSRLILPLSLITSTFPRERSLRAVLNTRVCVGVLCACVNVRE